MDFLANNLVVSSQHFGLTGLSRLYSLQEGLNFLWNHPQIRAELNLVGHRPVDEKEGDHDNK